MSLAAAALAAALQTSCFSAPIGAIFVRAQTQLGSVGSEQLKLIGFARDPKSSELRYCEQYWLTPGDKSQAQQVRIDYFSPSGQRFAYKRLTTTDSPYHYDVLQQRLNGERQAVTHLATSPQQPSLLELSYQSNSDARRRHKTLKRQDVDIVDSALHFWIQDHWQQLMQGQRLQATVASPRHLLAAKANIERSDCRAIDDLPASQHSSEQCVIIAPSNVLLRWFVPALRLGYDTQRRLRDYLGLTNISTDGSNRTVYVQYHHAPD